MATATVLKMPAGGDACPKASSPQHTTSPPTRTAQACQSLTATDTNSPAGDAGSGSKPVRGSSSPQHTNAPPTRIAQALPPPTDTAANSPAGGSVT